MALQHATPMWSTAVYVQGGDGLKLAGMALQTEVFARRYYSLFNERLLDEAERLVDPEALFSYPAAKEHVVGRAGYRELVRRWLEGFPDARIDITAVYVFEPQTAQTEWTAHGTHHGMLELPGFQPIPPSGRRASLPMRESITIRNGLIVESVMEFDPVQLQRVLGIHS